jgi:hypothetical protein
MRPLSGLEDGEALSDSDGSRDSGSDDDTTGGALAARAGKKRRTSSAANAGTLP